MNPLLFDNDKINYTIMDDIKKKKIDFFDKLVCINFKSNIWYHFSEHRWKKVDEGLISIKLLNHYSMIYNQNKIVHFLQNINFMNKIIEKIKSIFYDTTFIENLDENPNLIGFENGVYDLEKKIFREGYSDDYISMSTNVHYSKWEENNEYAVQIHEFFEKILPNKKVRDFFLSKLSRCLSGKHSDKIILCKGNGSNGKSICFNLISKAFGDYCIYLDGTNGTNENNNIKGKRIEILREPNKDNLINLSVLIEKIYNDNNVVRELQIKSWMMSNFLPFQPNDENIMNYVDIIDFNSKFINNPDLTNPNEFLSDNKIGEKTSLWASAFASYLVHIYTTQ